MQPAGPYAPPQSTPPTTNTSGVEKRRVHHSYIWLGGLGAACAVIVVLLLSGSSGIVALVSALSELSNGSAALAFGTLFTILAIIVPIVVIFGIVVGLQALSYKYLWYEVGPEEISVYSGIFVKKRVHVPYQKIQSVDERASLIQRIFGVCNVFIDTAGGASNKAVRIPYLRKRDAEDLRHELYARKQYAEQAQAAAYSGAVVAPSSEGNFLDFGENAWRAAGDGFFSGGTVAMEAPTFEYRLTNKELFFTGLSNSSGFVLAILALVGVLSQLFSFADIIAPSSSDALIATGGVLFSGAEAAFGLGLAITFLAVGIILAAAVIWGFSILGTCIQYGGFHARRRGSRIEVERGLLKHQTDSLDIERVQSVIIKQSFIRRIIGYCELSLGKVSASHESDSGNQQNAAEHLGLVVHPFVKVSQVNAIINGLIPEYAAFPPASVRVAPVALRRGLIRRCIWQGGGFWLAISTLVVQIIMYIVGLAVNDPDFFIAQEIIGNVCAGLYVVAAILVVYDIVNTVYWFRESALGANTRFLVLKNGGLSNTTITIPRNKIQFGYTRTNPLQRMAKTSTVLAETAAGITGTTTQLIDVHEEVASRYLAWIEPHGGNTSLTYAD